MEKSDQQIHKICLRNIKKSLFSDAELKFTKFYELTDQQPDFYSDFQDDEIAICSTRTDSNNRSLLTTQRLLTKSDNILKTTEIEYASHSSYGDFKGYKDPDFTIGRILIAEGTEFEYFTETGKASMVMVQGVKTRIQIQNRT